MILEVKTEKAKEVAAKVEKIMESVIDPKETEGVVFKAVASIGKDWGELK